MTATLVGPGGTIEIANDVGPPIDVNVVGGSIVFPASVEVSNDVGAPVPVSGTVSLEAATLTALESITATIANWPADFPDAAVLAKLELVRALLDGTLDVAVSNFPASQPVSGTVALDGPTLAALESITVAIAGGQLVGLDATSLSALENIIVSGTVALDGPTLAALENVVVSGSVALDAGTLAALETINAIVSGAVSVSNFPASQPVTGPLTDAQLRAFAVPVSGTVTTTGLTDTELRATAVPISGALTDVQLRATPVPVSGTVSVGEVEVKNDSGNPLTVAVGSETFTKKSVTASASGNNTIHTPAAGKKVRLYFFGYSAGANVTGCLVGMRFGAAGTIFDQEYLIAAGQPYARNIQAGKRYVDGAVDEALIVNLSAAQTVYCNAEIEEI